MRAAEGAHGPGHGRHAAGEVESVLLGFGFTEIESKLYCELLRSGPASGYRLAQRISKAAANVYQALKTLAQKGAVIASEGMGEATTYRPTPPSELLAMLRTSFEERQQSAHDALEAISTPASDERVYSVPSVALLFERARSMLAQAQKIALIDIFPTIYDLLRPDLDAARERGVIVSGIAYAPQHVNEYMPLNPEASDLVLSRWAGHGLMLAVDGQQLLLAQVSADLGSVLNGVWTDSAFLSCILHSGIAADVRLVTMRTDPSDPMRILSLQQSQPMGLRQMLQQRLAANGDADHDEGGLDKPTH